MNTKAMNEYAIVDGSQYPIIYISINKMEPNLQSANKMYDDIEAICNSNDGSFVIIGDVSKGTSWVSAEVRTLMADRFQNLLKMYDGRYIASVMVLTNMVTRMIVRGVNLLTNIHNRQIITTSKEEAIEKAIDVLNEEKEFSIT